MRFSALLDQLDREVRWLPTGAQPASTEFRVQATISILARVPILLSAATYSESLRSGSPPVGLDNTLAAGAGACGNHVELGLALFYGLGVPARDVQIYYVTADGPQNHTVVEAYWDEAWRMVDLTYGFIPHRGLVQSALSFTEAQTERHRLGLHHQLIPWRLATEANYDVFGYLDAKTDTVLYDGEGLIAVEISEGPAKLPHEATLYVIGPKPHYRTGPKTRCENVITLRVPQGRWEAEIGGTAEAETTLCVGRSVHQVAAGQFTITHTLKGPDEIELGVTGDDAAPVRIDGVTSRRR